MSSTRRDQPVRLWFFRHGQMESHLGDLPLTELGRGQAEAAGERLASEVAPGARVEFMSAPPVRARQTAEGIRRGLERTVGRDDGVALGTPRVEQAIRNGDLFVAGHRVEMVKSAEAVADQLPAGLLTLEEIERNRFFSAFWSAPDPMGYWLNDPDPPGERAADVARRFDEYSRSLCDVATRSPRLYVCATHSGALRALVRHRMGLDDPGEPEYAEAVELDFGVDGVATWRFRDAVVVKPA
jgi:broad specificity phosphatase PhoE